MRQQTGFRYRSDSLKAECNVDIDSCNLCLANLWLLAKIVNLVLFVKRCSGLISMTNFSERMT